MSSTGPPTRDTARVAIALLTIAGLVLVAAVVPAIGGDAPGRSLLPDRGPGTGGGLDGGADGRPGSAANGSRSLVGGLFGDLQRNASVPSANGTRGVDGVGRPGRGGFGALDPGRRAGVGSAVSPTSESLRSQSARPHFVVESPTPTYWRTGAYAVYTGSGWENRGQVRRDLPLTVTGGGERRRVRQRVTLLEPATALPAAWQPVDVDGDSSPGVYATRQRALRAPGSLPANATYTVESSLPASSPERLRRAGRDYPARTWSVYTRLPADTPGRLTTFTDRITRDASNPYETAVAVERWLEANKAYSLNASHDGENVASRFVFEMERGYCEYFATSMTAMLRTQGVPARYVVGYSTGEPRGEDEYLVRGANAHAWVEVYFPDTGWVRFDPTPAASRLANEARAVRERTGDDEAARSLLDRAADPDGSRSGIPETGTRDGAAGDRDDLPGAPEPGDDRPSRNGTGADSRDGNGTNGTDWTTPDGTRTDGAADRPYRISLLGDPVPGQYVTVEVTRGGDPAADVPVRFDGERVGTTNASGLLRARVPFVKRLVVGVGRNATADGGAETGSPPAALGGPPLAGDVGGVPAASLTGVVARSDDGNETVATFDVPTNLSVAVVGTADPGATATLRVHIGDAAVPDATVTVDGERAGRTGADGTAVVRLPANESATVGVRRGAASGNRTLTLANVSVATSGVALPGLSLGVAVTDGGDPVEGATVSVGGRAATTGPDGTASVALPFATGATLRVETPAGIEKTRSVAFAFLPAALALGVVLAVVGGLVTLRRRALSAGRTLGEHVAVLARWLSAAFVSALVAAAVRGDRLLAALPALVRRLVARVRAALAAAVAALRTREVDLDALPDPRGLLGALVARVRRAVAAVRGPGAGDGSEPTAAGAAAPGSSSEPTASERVERAWRDFRARVPGTDHATRTPGELARRAVDAGFPRPAVETLTDAFRATRYGRRDPREYVAAAEAARDAVRSRIESDGDAGASATDDGRDAPDGGSDA